MKWFYFLLLLTFLAYIPASYAVPADPTQQSNANKKKINSNKAAIVEQRRKLNTLQKKTTTQNQSRINTDKKLQKGLDKLNTQHTSQQQKIISNEQNLSKHSEQLNTVNENAQEIADLRKQLSTLDRTSGVTKDYIDRFWVLIAAALVFFMQAGFKTFETGMVRKEHNDSVAIKNVIDWLVVSIVYFFIGFGIMFGDSWYGFIGSSLFAPSLDSMEAIKNSLPEQYLGLEFFLYQLAFAATAATIVSGAMSERTALIPYIALSIFIGIFIYPVFGHWAWGGAYLLTDTGWLYNIGFRDFAGSTVVHSIGAWIALAGIITIGARHGRYDVDGNINTKDFRPSNLGYSVLGVFILWFGWWGFNGGSQLKYDESIASIILNTTLAGAAAGITAFFHALSKSRDKYDVFPKLLGGILGGLVAITACCNVVSANEAIVIGVIAGLIHNYSYDFLMLKLKLDDPVGAIAVHGFCGVWGTLSVAFFGDLSNSFFVQNSITLFAQDSFPLFTGNAIMRIEQVFIQLFGVIIAFIFAFSSAYLFFKFIRMIPFIGLRVRVKDEKEGSPLGISF